MAIALPNGSGLDPVPEPASLCELLLGGLAVLFIAKRRSIFGL